MGSPGRTALFVSVALLLAILAGCGVEAKHVPVEPDLTGTNIVVWDVDQVAIPRAPGYREEAARVVEDFCARYKTSVDLEFVDRGTVQDYLSGGKDALSLGEGLKPPDVVFTCEWPFAPADAADVAAYLQPSDYLDAALEYWRRDGKIMAVPAYIHWFAVGCRVVRAGQDGQVGQAVQRTAYFLNSRSFLDPVLDMPSASWDVDSIAAFLSYVKETYGPPAIDPLSSWMDGSAQALYPVTPFLLKWMKETGTGEVRPLPIGNPFGEASFYYTVPGYVVLAKDGAQKECAGRLARELAANLGRWVARSAGGIPALAGDVSVFLVESGFSYEERLAVLSCLSGPKFHAPSAQDFLLRESVEKALRPAAMDFLSGKTGDAELRSSIQEVLRRHTKP